LALEPITPPLQDSSTPITAGRLSVTVYNARVANYRHMSFFISLLIELGDFGYFGPAFMLVGEKFLGLLRPDILN
jgi:hypothetical protein